MNKEEKSGMAAPSMDTDKVAGQESQENVEKIRDILFGGYMRDYEQRFREMEKLVAQSTASLGKDMSARIEQLESFVKKEFSLLTDKLNHERKERKQDGDEASAALADARKAIENRIADIDEVHGSAEQEIRNRLHEQANELMETMRKNQDAFEHSIRLEARRLNDEKVAREDLAGLFAEVAMRLQREPDLPDNN